MSFRVGNAFEMLGSLGGLDVAEASWWTLRVVDVLGELLGSLDTYHHLDAGQIFTNTELYLYFPINKSIKRGLINSLKFFSSQILINTNLLHSPSYFSYQNLLYICYVAWTRVLYMTRNTEHGTWQNSKKDMVRYGDTPSNILLLLLYINKFSLFLIFRFSLILSKRCIVFNFFTGTF